MADLWPKYTHEELAALGFGHTSHADAQDLAFLNYGAISSEQIADMNDAESFVSMDVSILSDSTEEETQEWRCAIEKLDSEMKTLKETYV